MGLWRITRHGFPRWCFTLVFSLLSVFIHVSDLSVCVLSPVESQSSLVQSSPIQSVSVRSVSQSVSDMCLLWSVCLSVLSVCQISQLISQSVNVFSHLSVWPVGQSVGRCRDRVSQSLPLSLSLCHCLSLSVWSASQPASVWSVCLACLSGYGYTVGSKYLDGSLSMGIQWVLNI